MYRDLLLRWSTSISLSSRSNSDSDGFQSHIADSLSTIPHLPIGLDRFIDLGSGQGFPAIPIAIETGIAADLIEADRRKAAFLTTAMATLGLSGTVHCTRIEATHVAPAACVTARALASLDRLLRFARPLLRADGCCLFLKGPAAASELADAAKTTSFEAIIVPGSARSNLVKVTRLR